MTSDKIYTKVAVSLITALAVIVFIFLALNSVEKSESPQNKSELNMEEKILDPNIPQYITSNFDTDLSKASVNWSEVVGGGPPKDGIPSIDNPKFESINDTDIPQDTEGLLLEIAGEAKFYPYNILVRHEIVNDFLADTPVLVTFCPLCGSGIAFNRTVDGEVTEFGVSGFLRESNMIMYDRNTESLWQQALGTSIAGDLNSQQLEFLPVQLSTVEEATASNPEAQILTTDTGIPGYSKGSYQGTPYGDYDENDSFIFQPSSVDERFPSKEIFQIVPIGDYSVAIRRENIETGQTYTFTDNSEIDLTITVDSTGKIKAVNSGGVQYPAYFEMWFSWAVQHEDDGMAVVWEPVQ